MFDSLVKNDNKAAFTRLAEASKAQQPLSTASKTTDIKAGDAKLGHLIKLRSLPPGSAFWNVPVVIPSQKK
jgi:hypothetical protein